MTFLAEGTVRQHTTKSSLLVIKMFPNAFSNQGTKSHVFVSGQTRATSTQQVLSSSHAEKFLVRAGNEASRTAELTPASNTDEVQHQKGFHEVYS